MGTIGKPACEAQAMAMLNGEWDLEKTTALLIGSYVDSHFEGSLDLFRAQNPAIFTKSGDLKADYKKRRKSSTVLKEMKPLCSSCPEKSRSL